MPELPPVDDPEEALFQRLYGPWQAWTPTQAAAVLADWTDPWWIAGGWAIEAFTGRPRPHAISHASVARPPVAAVPLS